MFMYMSVYTLSDRTQVWPLCASAKFNLGERVLGVVEKNSFIFCQAKQETKAPALKT